MKKKSTFICFVVMCMVAILSNSVHAWECEIRADRESSHDYVIIGVAQEESSLPCPPDPPDFYCRMCIRHQEERFLQLVYKEVVNGEYRWSLEINPNGGIGGPPGSTTTTLLKWDFSSIPETYTIQLIDNDNNIVVCDMRQIESVDIIGKNNWYTYTVIATPGSGSASRYDMNGDCILDLKDVIFLLKQMTEINQ
jgi:hypothetical protein